MYVISRLFLANFSLAFKSSQRMSEKHGKSERQLVDWAALGADPKRALCGTRI